MYGKVLVQQLKKASRNGVKMTRYVVLSAHVGKKMYVARFSPKKQGQEESVCLTIIRIIFAQPVKTGHFYDSPNPHPPPQPLCLGVAFVLYKKRSQ